MSMDNIQLKQEDGLKDDVVLSDINPVTNTASVDDSATGEKLQKTIEMIWNAINNKLTRVVNSVNGRTGVVVLSSEDVGLGNVDNVSFTDIKKWLIERMEQAFKDKRLYLFEDISGVDQIVDLNDDSYAWAPFFCETVDGKNGAEQKACIGLFTWDETTATLSKEYVVINTLGFDHIYDATNGEGSPSIIYDQNVEKRTGNINMSGGGIAVNIHNDEDALYIDGSGSTKRDQGLRIDKSKVSSRTFFIDGVYGYNETYKWTSNMREGYFNDQDNIFYMEYDETSHTYSDRAEGRTNEVYVDLRPYEDEETHKTLYRTYSYTTDGIWVYRSSAEADDVLHSHTWLGEQRADSFLIWQTQPTSDDPECALIIDGEEHTVHLNHEWLAENDIRENDIIMCNFMYDKYVFEYKLIMRYAIWATDSLEPLIPPHMDYAFFSLNPAIGTVTSAPSIENPDRDYIITMHSIRTNVDGCGLTYIKNHVNELEPETNAKSQMGLQMISDGPNSNLSGLNGLVGYFNPVTRTKSLEAVQNLSNCKMFMTPNGSYMYHVSTGISYTTGFAITPDDTLCTFLERNYTPNVGRNYSNADPTKSFYTFYDIFNEKDTFFGSSDVLNFSWPLIRNNYSDSFELDGGSQFMQSLSRLSVKRNMLVGHPKDYQDADKNSQGTRFERFINVSGLAYKQSRSGHVSEAIDNNKTIRSNTDNHDDYLRRFGMGDHLDAYGDEVENCQFFDESGGLYVNIGRFLEISPKRNEASKDFDESGKINVRIGEGLTEKAEYVDVPFDSETGLYKVSEGEFSRYYNEFAKKDLVTGEIIPFKAVWEPLKEKPADWETNWWAYGFSPSVTELIELNSSVYKIKEQMDRLVYHVPKTYPPDFSTTSPEYFEKIGGTTEDPVYKKLTKKPFDWYYNCSNYYTKMPLSPDEYVQLTPAAPTFVPQDPSMSEAYKQFISPFYERVGYDQNGMKVAVVTVATMSLPITRERYQLIRLQKSNRISVAIDKKTLMIDHNGNLHVSDTVGGKNIRIADARGCYFDTDPSKLTIDDFIQLGTGLKVIGGTCPKEYFSNKLSLKNYILDTLGDINGTNLTIADCIGVYIRKRLRTTDPDPSYYTADLNNVGPRGVGAIYSPLSMTPSSSLELSYVNTCYTDMMDGFDLGKDAMMTVYPRRQYLQVTGSALKDRISDIIDTAMYKTNYFELFSAVKSRYSLGISFDESDSASTIRAKFTPYFSNPIILNYFSDDEYPLDWLFNEYVEMLAIAPDSGDTPTPTPTPTSYELVHPAAPTFETGTYYLYDDQTQTYSLRDPDEEPSDWATSYVNYYTRSGSSEPYTYTQVTGEPSDWQSDFGTYYTQDTVDTSVYNPVEGVAPVFEHYKYYSEEGFEVFPPITLTEQPDDWETNYMDYYVLKRVGLIQMDFVHVEGVAPTFEDNKYYRAIYTG